jgi:RNA polymerase sigma factor (sigma-70 family)
MPDPLPPPSDDDPVAWAAAHLGPASAEHVARPAVLAAVVARRAAGADLEDAVLAEIHGAHQGNGPMADEFVSYFQHDLERLGRQSMSRTSPLRRHFETSDLVASVYGDVWGHIADLEFETRHQFKALFEQRLHWKASDKARRLSSQRRREDRRVPQRPEELLDLKTGDAEHDPHARSVQREESRRVVLAMVHLKPRDRELIGLRMNGASIHEIAEAVGLSYEAAQKALRRAIDHLARLLPDPSDGGPDHAPGDPRAA